MFARALEIGAVTLLLGAQLTHAAERALAKTASELAREVADTERAFARTMAERDLPAFGTFIAEEAVFFSGSTPLRGKQQIIDHWKRFYQQPAPPFSWAPSQVEVLDSGTLALSTGAVRDPSGKEIATFTSIWRLEPSGAWRIVFDKGCDVCPRCAPPQPSDLRDRPER
jgi:ketosteroid isomerase-like protein